MTNNRGKTYAVCEQNKLKRAGTGLRALDHDRACLGFTLFAPQSGGGSVYLIDLDGNVNHTWQMPYAPGNYGYLTDRGTLFYNGRTAEDSARYISRQPWKGGAVLEADWKGRVRWEVRHPDHHHDGIRLRNGNVLLLCLARLPQNLVAEVRGGMPGTEHNGEMYADYLVEMTTEGAVIWEWRCGNISIRRPIASRWFKSPEKDGRMEMAWPSCRWRYHRELSRDSTVIIIDRETGEIIWKLGAPPRSLVNMRPPLCRTAIFYSSTTVHTVWMIQCLLHVSSSSSGQPRKSSGSIEKNEKAISSVRGFQMHSVYRTVTR